jgi:DNA-binding NarL/FixJ family response regulator
MTSSPKRPRILLIEDEFLIAVSVQEMLEDLDCEVVGPIATLAEALDLCLTADADAAVVNLILQGKPAYAVATILAAREIPFGFASGVDHQLTDDSWKERPFLSKPYSASDLREFLKQVLPDHIMPESKF